MNLIELNRALRQLRLGGIAAVLETRLHQAQAEAMAPVDLISCLVADELSRRSERLLDSHTASWARAQVRPAQLAHQSGGNHRGRHTVIPTAGFCRPGLHPATPPKPIQNLSMKEKQKHSAPSRWSGPSMVRIKGE